MKKKLFIVLAITYVIFFLILTISNLENNESKKNKNTNLLTESEYGDSYPYLLDNLELKCSYSAVWVETQTGEKYALNGLAINLLKDDPLYMGNTNQILKPNKTDFNFLEKGLKCKK